MIKVLKEREADRMAEEVREKGQSGDRFSTL